MDEALATLGMDREHFVCAYCGGVASDWDHLHPLVRDRRPTGYIHEIRNCVPACGRCNQSKGASEWRDWIVGPARNSPQSRGITDIDVRIAALERFEAWAQPRRYPFSEWVGEELWTVHWANLAEVERKMRDAQVVAVEIQKAIALAMKQRGQAASFDAPP